MDSKFYLNGTGCSLPFSVIVDLEHRPLVLSPWHVDYLMWQRKWICCELELHIWITAECSSQCFECGICSFVWINQLQWWFCKTCIFMRIFYSMAFYFVCTLILGEKNRCWLQFTCNGQSQRTSSLNSFRELRRNCIWWIIEVLQYSLNSMTVVQPLFSCGLSHSDYLFIALLYISIKTILSPPSLVVLQNLYTSGQIFISHLCGGLFIWIPTKWQFNGIQANPRKFNNVYPGYIRIE